MKIKTRLLQIIHKRGLVPREVAAAVPCSLGTLYNAASSPTSVSPKLLRGLTQAVRETVWDDVPLRRSLTLPAGTELDFLTEIEAEEAALEFGDSVDRIGCCLTLRRSIEAVFEKVDDRCDEDNFEYRINRLRREITIAFEDFRAGRLKKPVANNAQLELGKKLEAIRREAEAQSDEKQLAEVEMLSPILRMFGSKLRRRASLETPKEVPGATTPNES